MAASFYRPVLDLAPALRSGRLIPVGSAGLLGQADTQGRGLRLAPASFQIVSREIVLGLTL